MAVGNFDKGLGLQSLWCQINANMRAMGTSP